jgi:hypothetical protein
MLLKSHVNELVNMDADTLSRIARDSGYKDAKFLHCEFVGITNSGDFCYGVTYKDYEYGACKVYVWRDAAGNYVADY